MITIDKFQTIVENTPLVSIDFIIENNGLYLLGKRVNKPAQGYFFTPGGRIFKNETINQAFSRLSLKELGTSFDVKDAQFLGVFQHFYEDSFVSDTISTHYIVLVYTIRTSSKPNLPLTEHHEYHYFSKEKLLKNNDVHDYVKAYFRGDSK